MRPSLPITLLFVTLLSACAASSTPSPTGKHSQTGPLKVHSGLLGQPQPSAAQTSPQSAPAVAPKQ